MTIMTIMTLMTGYNHYNEFNDFHDINSMLECLCELYGPFLGKWQNSAQSGL